MITSTTREVVLLFRSYGLKDGEDIIVEWMKETRKENTGGANRPISEGDIYRFNEWSKRRGTAYEEGIDDKTKIDRMFEEICDLRKEIEELKMEKALLERQLGILPF
jgi:hypothetical protein